MSSGQEDCADCESEGQLDYDELIERNHLDVVNNLDLNRQFIFSYLRSKNVIDEEDCEIILNTAKTKKQKVSIFLDVIKRKGNSGMKHFVDALEFEHPQLYQTFTGKVASAVMAPPTFEVNFTAGLPNKEYVDLDRSVLAEQLEYTVNDLHRKACLVNKLQDEKNVLEKKLFEATEKLKSSQQYVNLIKSELHKSSEIKQLGENMNRDSLTQTMQSLQQEVMLRMNMVIALQGKLLAQTEEMEAMKTETFEIKVKSNAWKQEVYDLTLLCDNERRQSKRLNEQVLMSQVCDTTNANQIKRENWKLKMQIATLREDNERICEEFAEFRKYSEVLSTKFSILTQEKSEVNEKNEEISNYYKTLLEQMDEMEGKYKCFQCENDYLQKTNTRYLSDIKTYREIQKQIYGEQDKMKNEIKILRKLNTQNEDSLHSQILINRSLDAKYKEVSEEVDETQQLLCKAKDEISLLKKRNQLSYSRESSTNSNYQPHDIYKQDCCDPVDNDQDDTPSSETNQTLDIPAIMKIRSNKELLESIKRKVSDNDPMLPPQNKLNSTLPNGGSNIIASHHSLKSRSAILNKGLMSYEQLRMLFPTDLPSGYFSNLALANKTDEESTNNNNSNSSTLTSSSSSNETDTSKESIVSTPITPSSLSPFIFESVSLMNNQDIFGQRKQSTSSNVESVFYNPSSNQSETASWNQNEVVLKKSLTVDGKYTTKNENRKSWPVNFLELDSPGLPREHSSLNAEFRQRTTQVDIEDYLANSRRRSSSTPVVSTYKVSNKKVI